MMTHSDAGRLREAYLDRLDVALYEVPHRVATEIRAGIAEELEGLDAERMSARIEQFGDPAVIAREAQAEPALHVTAAPPAKEPLPRARGFAVASSLVLSFGGLVVPIVGWFVGVVMVLMSALWHRWEKAVALTLPFAVGALMGVVSWIGHVLGSQDSEQNPLVPAAYDLMHSGILLIFFVIPISGGWLLWRLRRR